MSTKFKFEMESEGLTEVQAQAFSTFVNSLQSSADFWADKKAEAVKADDEKVEEVKPKRRRKVVKQEAPEPTQEAPEPTQEAPEPTQEAPEPTQESDKPDLTIQDVRAKLQPLVKTHRDEIIKKLKEYGAKSVTLLDPKHFAEMHTFLDTLA